MSCLWQHFSSVLPIWMRVESALFIWVQNYYHIETSTSCSQPRKSYLGGRQVWFVAGKRTIVRYCWPSLIIIGFSYAIHLINLGIEDSFYFWCCWVRREFQFALQCTSFVVAPFPGDKILFRAYEIYSHNLALKNVENQAIIGKGNQTLMIGFWSCVMGI